MITTTTYRDQVGAHRDVLAAFSALDHRTTAELLPEQVDAAFRHLVAQLSALLFLHGASVPAEFLAALHTVRDHDGDTVALVASFIESGQPDGLADGEFSELQQELVHFSRIVAVGTLGLDDSRAHTAVRRLRNSRRLPESLKVLSELIIVARSRLLQRGIALPVPSLRPGTATSRTSRGWDASTTLWLLAETDYVLVVVSPRRRTRKQVAYLFTALLEYLTPGEAALALWTYAIGEKLHARLDIALVTVDDDSTSTVSWSHPGGDSVQATEDPITWCREHLPMVSAVGDQASAHLVTARGVALSILHSNNQVQVSVTGTEQVTYSTVLVPPLGGGTASAKDMVTQAHRLMNDYDGPDIVSIECGHIHLDRALDIDQEIGAMIGADAVAFLIQRQVIPPVLTPMMDDDHVLVKLHPADYRAFLEAHFRGEPMHLIAESSPIIRSIVCALWARLKRFGLAERCRQRGQNLFLELDNGNYCELFEDFHGATITGCVFFECALLVYRTAPRRFDDYFRNRFELTDGVHEQACRILDATYQHDDKIARLQALYATFDEVTDPRHPDTNLVALVDNVIESTGPNIAHLNVLEDYYEVQQDKVRTLIGLLKLPMRLVTVHFNAQTGRVVLDG